MSVKTSTLSHDEIELPKDIQYYNIEYNKLGIIRLVQETIIKNNHLVRSRRILQGINNRLTKKIKILEAD